MQEIPTNNLVFGLFLFIYCISQPVFAEHSDVLGQWKMTPKTSYASSCRISQIELFSCRTRLDRTAALCMDRQQHNLEMSINSGNNNPQVVILQDVNQVISSASAGGATILRGKSKKGEITLFFDDNYADDSSSNIFFPYNSMMTCDKNSIRDPEHLILGSNKKMQSINIWNLLSIGITKPFFSEVTNKINHDKEMKKLWRSWPN